MAATGGIINLPSGGTQLILGKDRPEQLIPLSDPMPAHILADLNKGIIGRRTEPWSITRDGQTQTAMVEVETMLNGGDRVMVSYPLLAKMLTDLGYSLPSDYDI